MMNLALNISLTDEQYNDLMLKTHDKLFESEEFVQELSKVILAGMGEYLKNNPSELRKALGFSENYYSMNSEQQNNRKLMTRVIHQAADGYCTEISDNVKIALQDILKKTDLATIMETVLAKAILKGMSSGLTEHLEAVDNIIGINSHEIEQLKSILNLN